MAFYDFKFPIITDRSMPFTVYKSPPKNVEFDPHFGYPELEDNPFPPKMLSDFNIDEFVDSLNLTLIPHWNQVSFMPEKTHLQHLNYDQRWIVGCNILHSLDKFIGELMDERIKYCIIGNIKKTIYYLAQIEIKPGVWDESY